MVVNSAAGTYTKTVTVSGTHNELFANGAYYAGNWYTQETNANILRADATLGGAQTDTGVNVGIYYTNMVTDYAAGMIYLSCYADFLPGGLALARYNPVAGTFVTLANAPSGIPHRGNMVITP